MEVTIEIYKKEEADLKGFLKLLKAKYKVWEKENIYEKQGKEKAR